MLRHCFFYRILDLFLLIFSIFIIVIPNSFPTFTFCLQCFLTFCILFTRQKKFDKIIMLSWTIISMSLLLFILLSPVEIDIMLNLFLRYILSPLCWLIILKYISIRFSSRVILNNLIVLSFIASISVVIFYFLFLNGYGEFLNILIDSPNIDATSLGFRLHVYGNLIFFAMSIIPIMIYINKLKYKIAYFLVLLLATILSGRTALISSLLLGLLIGFIYLFQLKILLVKNILISTKVIFSVFLFTIMITSYVDLSNYVDDLSENHLSKIKESGGFEREMQLNLMGEKIFNQPLGNGFIELSLSRNDINKWQYEALIPAFLMRFGIVVSFFVFCSIFFSIINVKLLSNSSIVYTNCIFLSGFIGIILFSFTNPYLEAPTFQWMFFIFIVFGTPVYFNRNFN